MQIKFSLMWIVTKSVSRVVGCAASSKWDYMAIDWIMEMYLYVSCEKANDQQMALVLKPWNEGFEFRLSCVKNPQIILFFS